MTGDADPYGTAAHRWVANCSMLFTEVPLLARPAAARAAGFDAVEFWWPFEHSVPVDADVEAFVSAVTDAGVALIGLNLPAGDMAAGDRGLISVPGREAELADGLAVAAGIGARLRVHGCNALYGNRIDGVDPARQDEVALANLARVAETLAVFGARVWLEPLSGLSAYPLRTATDALAVADRVFAAGAPEPLLLADLFHLTANGDDVAAVLEAFGDRIGHVQVADHPGRHEPGTGQIPFAAHLRALHDVGYDGWVAGEYAPRGDTSAGLGWLPRAHRAVTDG
ncbi:TIM barrel protein [Pseudonocardia sp. KRD291]|uniref:hydroxypyruvate isomerase family protein n=1 Tax=Pseudonocardia sp. KRD291 TaxID=2792007 RepID=UPI0027E2A458|nr:TIM barrel protein [Pseudonocardia sp. KRD291]